MVSCWLLGGNRGRTPTLFANKAVVPVVGVVRISRSRAPAVADRAEVELEELVAEPARVAGAVGELAFELRMKIYCHSVARTSTAGRTARSRPTSCRGGWYSVCWRARLQTR